MRDTTWVDQPARAGDRLSFQYRAHGEAHGGAVLQVGDRFGFESDGPMSAVAPGQTGALYEGESVVGSGIIDSDR